MYCVNHSHFHFSFRIRRHPEVPHWINTEFVTPCMLENFIFHFSVSSNGNKSFFVGSTKEIFYFFWTHRSSVWTHNPLMSLKMVQLWSSLSPELFRFEIITLMYLCKKDWNLCKVIHKWLHKWLKNEFLNDLMNEFLNDLMNEFLNDLMNDSINEWLHKWMTP